MAKNEGTVTIPIDRYLELTKFLEDVLSDKIIYIYGLDGRNMFTTLTAEEFIDYVKKENDDFARHNDALQKRIADFNKKPWYQRVFKSNV